MTDPPSSGLITRYVLENPWPLGIALVLLAIVLAWVAVRQGRSSTYAVAAAAILLGIIVLSVGTAITTPGEHGKRITTMLVDKVVENDLTEAAAALFDDSATLSFGSPNNPGLDIEYIRSMIDSVPAYKIHSNTIRMLDGFSESSDSAIVHLGCFTETDFGYAPTTWILRVERQDDGQWLITKVTWMTINNRAPSARGLQ